MHETELSIKKDMILIVEDEAAIRDMLGYSLIKEGFSCDEAADVDQARASVEI